MALAVLTALLLSSSLPVNAAAEDWLLPKTSEAPAFADTAGVWCEPEISVVCQVGLMAGKSADRFASQDPLTYAQITVIAARLHALLNGQDGTLPAAGAEEAWYQPALSLLEAECADPDVQSILKGFSDPAFPDSPCTRRSFALLLSGVLTEPLPAINDVDRVPDNMDPAVLALYNAGILTGSDTYGTFDEDGTLNRGQAAAMLARLVDPSLRQRFTLEPFDLCTDVLGLAPEAVVLTVGGAPVTAAEFANDLCTALHQAGGGSRTALDSAIHTWCFYTAPFQVLAEEKGVSLTEEEVDQAAQYSACYDGYLGLDAAYWLRKDTSVVLSSKLNDLYCEADWKAGTAYYHQDLDKTSQTLLEGAVIEPALESLDLTAAYRRLEASPFILWNFS